MSKEFELQVPADHYYKGYDDILRFISYYYQVDTVLKLNPGKVLEIGIGNKTVSNYLTQYGLKVDTCDFDESLMPDYVADIRKLPFEDNSYDVVIACEILEHLPWEDLSNALSELHRVSRKHVLISIPYASEAVELVLRFPLIGRFFKRPFFSFMLRIPHFFRAMKFDGQHYWEMGRKKYPRKRIRNALREFFDIKKELRPILKQYHYYFLLEKK